MRGGADVNARDSRGRTPLITAVAMRAGRTSSLRLVCELLAAPGVDVNLAANDGRTALAIARERGHLAVEMLLLAAGVV